MFNTTTQGEAQGDISIPWQHSSNEQLISEIPQKIPREIKKMSTLSESDFTLAKESEVISNCGVGLKPLSLQNPTLMLTSKVNSSLCGSSYSYFDNVEVGILSYSPSGPCGSSPDNLDNGGSLPFVWECLAQRTVDHFEEESNINDHSFMASSALDLKQRDETSHNDDDHMDVSSTSLILNRWSESPHKMDPFMASSGTKCEDSYDIANEIQSNVTSGYAMQGIEHIGDFTHRSSFMFDDSAQEISDDRLSWSSG